MPREYPERLQFFTESVPSLLDEALEQNNWKTVLDLGCGDGALLDALNKRGHLDGKTVYAIDFSEQRINSAKMINDDFFCSVGDASDTQLEDNSIDFVISTQVVEHVLDDAAMIQEIRRITAKNGTVYLSTIFKQKYAWYFYRCNGKWTIDPTHVREYTEDEQLLSILEDHGLTVLECKKTLESRPLMDAILRRLRASGRVYEMWGLKPLRRIRLPIPGYFNWEILCRKS